MIDRKAKARLDADGTARPLTQITQRFGYREVNTAYGIKKQGYIDHYELHDLVPEQTYPTRIPKLSWWELLKLKAWYYLAPWD